MAEIRFILNGQNVEANVGSTILEAAEHNGISIPTLCHDPRLKPTAACRLCLVEVEGAKGPMPACTTPLSEGMVVKTNSDNLFKLRQMALELLLSDHYGDCVAPCKLACPAGIDIQGYISLIANGQYREAVKLIKESNPLPLVCGRVCPRFCEQKCRRNLVDEPVAINFLKRFVADYDFNNEYIYHSAVKPPTGHKVAIIGGGPAGLAAAYYLAIEGHSVTIFDSSPQLGGMLRYGIPEYRLPKSILDKEIATITSLCKEVYFNTALGKDFTIESLKEKGYQAIFVALGAQLSQKMNIEGEDLPGVLLGTGFLRDVILGGKVNLGSRVAVIGGGNTAIDAARTAMRLNAGEVSVVYRRTRQEMPANDEEIEQAELEGVKFILLAAPTKVIAKNGRANALECNRMALGAPDASGRRKPEPIPDSKFSIEVDTIIAAIGQNIDATVIPQGVQRERSNSIKINKETMETTVQGVFSGGDCVTGPATVVEAIGAGKKAAISINQYLRGEKVTPVKGSYNCSKGDIEDIDVADYETMPRISRTSMPVLPLEERRHNFKEIENGFTEEMAKTEAARCLSCGCQDVFECKLRVLATEYNVNDAHYTGRKHHLPIRENEHPYIVRDVNKCILCGRCVRICNEVEGVGALGFNNRGFNTVVGTAIDMSLSATTCESCGQCVSTCPTGALVEKITLVKPGPWEMRSVSTICPYCNVGCNLDLNMVGDKIVKITSPVNNPVNSGNLCKRGKFEYLHIRDTGKLEVPLIKRENRLVEATWEEAIALAVKELKAIMVNEGSKKLAVLASARLTNEELFLIQKLARLALLTNNIGGLSNAIMTGGFIKSIAKENVHCSYDDILTSDLVVTIGGDISQSYPVMAMKVREAVGKGTKLVTISHEMTTLDALAKIDLKVRSSITIVLLRAALNYIIGYDLVDRRFINARTQGFDDLVKEMSKYPFEDVVDMFWVKPARIIEFIHLYIRAKRPVIIVNTDTISAEELALINDMALVTGNLDREGTGIITLRNPGNAQGLIDMGVHNDYLPDHQPIDNEIVRKKFTAAWHRQLPFFKGMDTDGIIDGIENGKISGLMVFGIDAVGKKGPAIFKDAKFSVLMSSDFPAEEPYPDVVFPMATFIESEGTFTNCEHRIQHLKRAISPVSGKDNWGVIARLASALGYPMEYNTIMEVMTEISQLVPEYRASKEDKQKPMVEPETCPSSEPPLLIGDNDAKMASKLLKAVKK
jgi:formate dehydrogenase major subunit